MYQEYRSSIILDGISSGKNYTILEIAKLFKTKYKFVSERPGERFTSLSNSNLARKVLGYKPKHDLKKYIKLFIEKHRLN